MLLQGENAWVFVHEDDIADAVKHYFKFADDLEKEAKANAPKGTEPPAPTSLSCAVMDGNVLTPADVSVAL
jgi:large subunit ribosomal protein L10